MLPELKNADTSKLVKVFGLIVTLMLMACQSGSKGSKAPALPSGTSDALPNVTQQEDGSFQLTIAASEMIATATGATDPISLSPLSPVSLQGISNITLRFHESHKISTTLKGNFATNNSEASPIQVLDLKKALLVFDITTTEPASPAITIGATGSNHDPGGDDLATIVTEAGPGSIEISGGKGRVTMTETITSAIATHKESTSESPTTMDITVNLTSATKANLSEPKLVIIYEKPAASDSDAQGTSPQISEDQANQQNSAKNSPQDVVTDAPAVDEPTNATRSESNSQNLPGTGHPAVLGYAPPSSAQASCDTDRINTLAAALESLVVGRFQEFPDGRLSEAYFAENIDLINMGVSRSKKENFEDEISQSYNKITEDGQPVQVRLEGEYTFKVDRNQSNEVRCKMQIGIWLDLKSEPESLDILATIDTQGEIIDLDADKAALD